MRWKSWIIAFLIFAGVSLSFDQLFIRCVLMRDENSPSGRIKHLYQNNPGEIAVFGTSRVHGLDLGTNAFNYAEEGTSFALTDVFLQIELAKQKTTPLVVEMQFSDPDGIGDEGNLIAFVRDPRFRAVLRQFGKMEWRFYVPGIRYFGYSDWILKGYMNERDGVIKVTRGFTQSLREAPFDRTLFNQIVKARLQMTNGFLLPDSVCDRLVAEIASHPQRLFILVTPPFHPSYYSNFQNEDGLKSFESRLAAFPNVALIDWSRMQCPDEAFKDTLHLRREAMADFSRKLRLKIAEILRNRKLPPLVAP